MTAVSDSNVQEYKLDPECELRFEIESKDVKVKIELKNGLAEVFGTELVKGKKYEFTCGAKAAVFTWQGCTVELVGKPDVTYIARETPMSMYLNCHAAMERMREVAEKEDTRGPTVMVVGPNDVGKSTLCRLLLNYGVRMGRRPVYVDLDVGQGHIAIPGTVGALLVERPANVVDGFSQIAPLVFHYGYKIPTSNSVLYNLLVSKLAEVCTERLKVDKKAKTSGIVINTCGWIKGGCYELLTHAAQAFEVDTILVLDQERLYNDLTRDMPDFVRVIILPKSGGVVERSQTQRNEARDQLVREYFYGSQTRLHPRNVELNWNDAKIFKIGAPILPSSCMPLGMTAETNFKKLVSITPGPGLLHHILSISFAESPDEDIVQTNVAGFVCVINVDVERQVLTLLSPQPDSLPNTILLLSEIQFMDAH